MKQHIDYYGRIIIVSVMLILGGLQFFNLISNPLDNWYWFVIAILYTTIVNDMFCHRICSHGMFKIDTESITYKILTFLASVDLGYGPVRHVVMSHMLHHIHSDKNEYDVMNWRHYWYSTTIVSPLPRFNNKLPPDFEKYKSKMYKKYQPIMEDKWTKKCADYSIEISFVSLLLLFLLLPVILFNVIFMGRFLLTIMTGLAGICGHIKNFPLSYRNQDTDDTSSNNLIFHYLFLGLFAGMLQNNHHARPASISPNKKWWEIDTSKPFVLLLKNLIGVR